MAAYYADGALTQVYKSGQAVLPYADWAARGYRLPTEAEWEYAARGGLSGKRFPWGDTISHTQANYFSSTNYIYDVSPTRGEHPDFGDWPSPHTTSPVGYFAANEYGLHDMAGNVRQWCWDWLQYYVSGSQTVPRGPAAGGARVYRGGCYEDDAVFCRVASRYGLEPEEGSWWHGFRSVLPPSQ
jgi:formylglycine-generating enzyme required for sulfatase activity